MFFYCEIFKKKDVSYEFINRIIEHIVEKRDRRKLLNDVKWINDVIVDLINNNWTIYRATELFFINIFFKFLICEFEFTCFSDALSFINFTHIHNNENLQSIFKHFKTNEFVKHNYNDCLKSEFIIFDFIAFLLNACNITVNKISYEF